MDEDRPGDIQRLIKTFVLLNDPRARQVTTRFLAVLAVVAVLSATYVLAGTPGFTDAGAPTAQETASPTAPREHCLAAADVPGWIEAHPEYRVSQVRYQADGTACLSYSVVSPLA